MSGPVERLEGDRVELVALDDRIDLGQQRELAVGVCEAGSCRAARRRSSGPWGPSARRNRRRSAITSSAQTSTSPTMPMTERRKRRQTSAKIALVAAGEAALHDRALIEDTSSVPAGSGPPAHRAAAGWTESTGWSVMRSPAEPDARIEQRQQHVGDDVADDQRRREDQHEGRRDPDVADAERADDGRADRRQAEDDRHLDFAGEHVGQHHALIGDQRMERVGHGVLAAPPPTGAGPWRAPSRHIAR